MALSMPITNEFSLDQDADQSVHQAAHGQPGKPIKLRIQPQIYTVLRNRHRAGMYLGWKGVYWNLSCPSVEDALEVRNVLASLFTLLESVSGKTVQAYLDKWVQELAESPARTTNVKIRSAEQS